MNAVRRIAFGMCCASLPAFMFAWASTRQHVYLGIAATPVIGFATYAYDGNLALYVAATRQWNVDQRFIRPDRVSFSEEYFNKLWWTVASVPPHNPGAAVLVIKAWFLILLLSIWPATRLVRWMWRRSAMGA